MEMLAEMGYQSVELGISRLDPRRMSAAEMRQLVVDTEAAGLQVSELVHRALGDARGGAAADQRLHRCSRGTGHRYAQLLCRPLTFSRHRLADTAP